MEYGKEIEKFKKKIDSMELELKSIRGELNELEKQFQPNESPRAIIKKETIFKNLKPSPGKIKKSSDEIELIIGGNVFGKIGLLAIILASGWFVKYAFDNQLINESGRIMIGLIIGFLISIIGLWLAKSRYRVLPEPIFGAGFAILYVSILAMHYFYNLIGLNETFIILTLINLSSSILAYSGGLQTLYIFSLIGFGISPYLLSTGENSYRFLFGYLTFVNLLFLFISKKHSWKVAPFAVFLLNHLIFIIWAIDKIKISSFMVPFLFISSLSIIFIIRELILMPRLRKEEEPFGIVLIALNIIFYSLEGYWLVEYFYPKLVSHFFLGEAFLITLAFFIYDSRSKKYIESSINKKPVSGNTILLISWIAVFFAAITEFTDGRWLTMSWIVFAGSLSIIGALNRSSNFVLFSLFPWVIALGRLLFNDSEISFENLAVLNSRFALYVMASCLLSFTYYIQKNKIMHEFIKIYLYLSFIILIIGSLNEVRIEVRNSYYRNLGYSYVLAFYVIVTLAPGFLFSSAPLRISGIAVAFALILKLYLYDIWKMELLIRIIAFFPLGVGLLVLSIFYQKYRNKIIGKTQITSVIIGAIFLLSSLGSSDLMAEKLNISAFKYYKELTEISNKQITNDKNIYGVYQVDDELYRYSIKSDIRIVYNGKVVPYFIRSIYSEIGKKTTLSPMVIFEDISKEGRIVVLKLPEPPFGTVCAQLGIGGVGMYESGVTIKLGYEKNNWEQVKYASIHSYQDEQFGKVNRIPIYAGKYRYARIEFDSKEQFQISEAIYEPVQEAKENKVEFDLNDLKITNDLDTNSSIYYYENKKHSPISRIEIQFEEKRFHRSVKVFQKQSLHDSYDLILETVLFKKKDDSPIQSIEIPNTIHGQFKIVISDKDDPPLKIQKIEAFSFAEEIVFELPGKDEIHEDGKFILYYGNEYAEYPSYDFFATYQKELEHIKEFGHIKFKSNAQTKNEKFAYSPMEPPVSIWIIRGIFFIGLFGIAYPAYKMFKKYSAEIKELDNV